MASTLSCLAVLVAGGAALQQELVFARVEANSQFWNTFHKLPPNAPEWCKDESQLTWEQKRQRVADHATLQWAKGQVMELRASNQTIPVWMEDMVTKDERRGQTRWAVKESQRLQQQGKVVPMWMTVLVEEDIKWANRWAACKAAELQQSGEDVPQWMIDNGRKGVLSAASEKLAELQAQIDELEREKATQAALVASRGDVNLAQRRLALAAGQVVVPKAATSVKNGGALLKKINKTVQGAGI